MTSEPAVNRSYLESVGPALQARGCGFAPGLDAVAIEAIEAIHGFRFPPDLRQLLSHLLPAWFPNWREPDSDCLKEELDWPREAILTRVEHDLLWLDEWGPKPSDAESAKAIAAYAVASAPILIPLSGARYLPATPCRASNPVVSVHAAEIIYYGLDLPCYLDIFFDVPNPFRRPKRPRYIEFWSDIATPSPWGPPMKG